MRPLYLRGLANDGIIKSLLEETLHEMLGIRDTHSVVHFSYPRWPTADYISKVSRAVSDAIFETGTRLAKARFKEFNPDRTKLTPEMLDEMWLEATGAITKAIHDGFENGATNTVPGLEKSINEGAVLSRDWQNESKGEIEETRTRLSKKAKTIDYRRAITAFPREVLFVHEGKLRFA